MSSVQLPLLRAALVQWKGRSPCCILFGSGGCGFGVFGTDMPHGLVDRLSFCFGLSWFPGPRNSHILRKTVTEARAANKMHLLLLMLPNLPMSVDFKFTDYSLFLLFFSTKQPDLISKIFSGLSLWKAQIWFSQALQIIHSRKLDFFFI